MHQRYTLPVSTDADEHERLTAWLWAAGADGVWDRGRDLVGWFREPPTGYVPPGGTWEPEPDRDWQADWKAGIQPVVAGQVAVVPSWLRDEAPDVAHVVVLDPGQAFGTGHHPTTVLCLELLQQHDIHRRRVLDVGTGTGVLAIAAVLLGAHDVHAVDIDAAAVELAAENAAANGVTLQLQTGSVDVAEGTFDVVLANLLTDTVTRLADQLVAAIAPGGVLIASGVAAERIGGPRRAIETAGAAVVQEVERDGWVGLVARAGGAA